MESDVRDEYILPAAHYEAATVCWNEAGFSDSAQAADGRETDEYCRRKLQECIVHLEVVTKWDKCVHDTHIRQRAQKGLELVKWLKQKKGWA